MTFLNLPLNDGRSIIPIAFGTGTALFRQDCVNEVSQALKAGFRHLDTAQMYNNEESVGLAIQSSNISREELYVTTKYGGGKDVRTEFEESLRKLKLSYVELYLIHSPELISGTEEESWRAMEKLQQDGLAKSIGVSNYNITDMELLLKHAKIKPSVNQVRLSPGNWATETKQLAEYCAQHRIVLESFGGLGDIRKNPGAPVHNAIQSIAQDRGITPVQVVFGWMNKKGIVVVTTTSKVDRLKEYLSTPQNAVSLTGEDIAAIDTASSSNVKI